MMMKPSTPMLAGKHVVVAKDQPEYEPIDTVRCVDTDFPYSPVGHNTVIMAFRPSPADRQRIINGEDVYISLLTFGHAQQPIRAAVGPEAFGAVFHLPVIDRRQLDELRSSQGDGADPAVDDVRKQELTKAAETAPIGEELSFMRENIDYHGTSKEQCSGHRHAGVIPRSRIDGSRPVG